MSVLAHLVSLAALLHILTHLFATREMTLGGWPAVSKHQTLQAFASKKPQLAEDIFVAPNSSLIGDVSLGKSSSVWYGAVLRGGHAAFLYIDVLNGLVHYAIHHNTIPLT